MPFEKAFLGITNSMIRLIPILHAYVIREREREYIHFHLGGTFGPVRFGESMECNPEFCVF